MVSLDQDKIMAQKNRNKKLSKQQIAGHKAHKESIGPSHKKCQEFLEEKYPNALVTPPTGRPDFLIHKRNVSYFELKPVTGANDRIFLSNDQEKEVRRLLKKKIPVSMIYYKKSKMKKIDQFQFTVRPLNMGNLKRYCYSTKKSEQIKVGRIKFSEECF